MNLTVTHKWKNHVNKYIHTIKTLLFQKTTDEDGKNVFDNLAMTMVE